LQRAKVNKHKITNFTLAKVLKNFGVSMGDYSQRFCVWKVAE